MSNKKRIKEEDGEDAATNAANRPLSCKRCRLRKIKCNFEFPCSSCIRAKVECVRTVNDMRKKRPPVNYVTSLEKKVEKLTTFFEKFKNTKDLDGKQVLVDKTDLEELLSFEEPLLESNLANSHQLDEDSVDRAVYGPTSVYDDNLISKNLKLSNRVEEADIKALNKDPDVLHCIKLFFTWQYPDHNMFIFREAFLLDFFNPTANSLYCSKILILSICALGSKMSDDDSIYNKSLLFYLDAKSLLLKDLSRSSITSLQSFLLLAFYDICNGYNSSGWMLSGNAIRMGFDLGFQLNPEVWFVKSKEDLSPLDVDIRSRIYWGSYVADHFISLLLGRPSLLKMSDATIPETNDLPDLEWIDEFTYLGFVEAQNPSLLTCKEQSYISNPLKKIINLISISDNILDDIFTKSDIENNQTNHEDLDLLSRLRKTYEYNAQIMEWKRSLPPDLQWDRRSLKETAENPTMACIRYYYYVLILCLNRPFVGINTKLHGPKDQSLSPLTICLEAIEDLYEAVDRFQSIHGYRRVSIFMVYCSILSISVILLTNTSKKLIDEKRDHLQFFMNVLQGSSKTWKLAEKSYNLINIKLKAYENEEEYPSTPKAPESVTVLQNSPRNDTSEVNKNILLQQNVDIPFQALQQASAAHLQHSPNGNTVALHTVPEQGVDNRSIVDSNTELLFDKNLDFLGGPPVLMTSDLFNEDWEALFPDYMFNTKTT